MLEYNRIDISEGIDIKKMIESKQCKIFHYWYCKDIGFKYEPHLCNGSAFEFRPKSRRQYNCRGRSLKAPFPSVVPGQSFCRNNLTIPIFASANALADLGSYLGNVLYKLQVKETNKAVNQLQSQGRLSLYKAALGLTLAKDVG